MYRPALGDEYPEPLVEVLQKSAVDVLPGQVRDLLQCGMLPDLGRVELVGQKDEPRHEAHTRPTGRVIADGLEDVRVGYAVALDPCGRQRPVEEGGAVKLDRVGDDPKGDRPIENRLSVERFRQVVGGYAEVDEIAIDPVKPCQPPAGLAASFDVLPEALG